MPILKTLKLVSQNKSIQNDLKNCISSIAKEGSLQNLMDGELFKKDDFSKNNPDAWKLNLYQDTFKVVNPFGAAKRKHKLLAVYINLANLSDHHQSHTSTMKLVALCKEVDFDHDVVYDAIVKDLKKLEDGVRLNDKLVKGVLLWISGDNLGSHEFGSYPQNFSRAKYFCRFCLISREQFYESVNEVKDY